MTIDRTAEAGYKKLKIYKLAHDLALKVHKMTLNLPKFETFEEGSTSCPLNVHTKYYRIILLLWDR